MRPGQCPDFIRSALGRGLLEPATGFGRLLRGKRDQTEVITRQGAIGAVEQGTEGRFSGAIIAQLVADNTEVIEKRGRSQASINGPLEALFRGVQVSSFKGFNAGTEILHAGFRFSRLKNHRGH